MFLEVYPQVLGASTLKRCTGCGECKPVDEFARNRVKPDGRQNQCKACNAAYRDKHREELRQYASEYHANNRDRVLEEMRDRYVRDRLHRLARANKHHVMHRDRILAARRAKPDIVIAQYHRRKARKLNNGGTFTPADLAAIRAAQTDAKGRLICAWCHKPIIDTPHLDHWIPLSKGGANDAGNLRYMHAKCNLSKGAKHPHDMGRLI